MNFDKNYQLQECIGGGREERLIFADQVIKFNRRLRPERRDLVITAEAMYICMRIKKNNAESYKMTRRNDLRDIQSVTLSTLQDNFFVMKLGADDVLMENQRKTEIVAVIGEYYEAKVGRKLTVEFSDNIQFKLKTGDTRTIAFKKDEGAAQAKLRKNGKTLTVGIATGLDKNTDTAPQGVQRPTNTAGRGRGTTGGGGGRGGGGNTGGGGGQVQQPQTTGGGGNTGGRGKAVLPPQGGGRGGGPPPPSNVPKAQAQYSYQGQTQDELSFNEGDVIIIHKKDPGGWWEGELNGKRGWIPANYVKEV